MGAPEARLGPYLLGPNDENQGIYTGDARELVPAIPDESVDLIFTDPIYDQIDDYKWLAEAAGRVLRPDRACLVFCAIGLLPQTHSALLLGGLDYRWRIIIRPLFGHGTGQWLGRLRVSTKEILWYEKGKSKLYAPLFDLQQVSTFGYADFKVNGRVWQKHPNEVLRALAALSQTNDVVLDLFCGSGVISAVSKTLGRRWLAFEIDPEVANRARERVRKTQPPLFVLEPEQMELELEGQSE